MVKAVLPVISFAARHIMFVVFAMLVGCLLWTLTYGALLLVAVMGNHGLGGPLAYPAGIITILAACIFLGWGVFAPATAFGAILCTVFQWPRLAAIPWVFLAAFLLSLALYAGYIHGMTTDPMPPAWDVLKNFSVFLSLPLGVYWWLTEGPGALFEVLCRRLKRVRNRGRDSGMF